MKISVASNWYKKMFIMLYWQYYYTSDFIIQLKDIYLKKDRLKGGNRSWGGGGNDQEKQIYQ